MKNVNQLDLMSVSEINRLSKSEVEKMIRKEREEDRASDIKFSKIFGSCFGIMVFFMWYLNYLLEYFESIGFLWYVIKYMPLIEAILPLFGTLVSAFIGYKIIKTMMYIDNDTRTDTYLMDEFL